MLGLQWNLVTSKVARFSCLGGYCTPWWTNTSFLGFWKNLGHIQGTNACGVSELLVDKLCLFLLNFWHVIICHKKEHTKKIHAKFFCVVYSDPQMCSLIRVLFFFLFFLTESRSLLSSDSLQQKQINSILVSGQANQYCWMIQSHSLLWLLRHAFQMSASARTRVLEKPLFCCVILSLSACCLLSAAHSITWTLHSYYHKYEHSYEKKITKISSPCTQFIYLKIVVNRGGSVVPSCDLAVSEVFEVQAGVGDRKV